MDKCVDMLELLSAYADGEVTAEQSEKIAEHLSECDDCSALVNLYKEMNIAGEESLKAPPDSIRKNIMSAITSGDVKIEQTGSYDETGELHETPVKSKTKQAIFIKRYLPAVACLAVILLALPFVINERTNQDQYNTWSSPDTAPALTTEDAQTFPTSRMEAAYDAYGADEAARAVAGGIAPAAIAPFETAEAEIEVFFDDIADDAQEEDDAFHMRTEDDVLPEVADTPPLLPVDEDAQQPEQHLFGALDAALLNSYVLIEIQGELPEALIGMEYVELGTWSIWDRYFTVPKAVGLELAEALEDEPNVDITFLEEGSEYAIIMFKAD